MDAITEIEIEDCTAVWNGMGYCLFSPRGELFGWSPTMDEAKAKARNRERALWG